MSVPLFYIKDPMEAIAGVYRHLLQQNPRLSLKDFCADHSMDETPLRRWLYRHNMSPTQMSRQARLTQGTQLPAWPYDYCRVLEARYFLFRMRCAFDVGLDVYMKSRYGEHDRRHILPAAAVKGSSAVRHDGFAHDGSEAYGSALAGVIPEDVATQSALLERTELTFCIYAALLVDYPGYTFSDFCADYGVNRHRVPRWLAAQGLSLTEVKSGIGGINPDDWKLRYARVVHNAYAEVREGNSDYGLEEFLDDHIYDFDRLFETSQPKADSEGREAAVSLGLDLSKAVAGFPPQASSRITATVCRYAVRLLEDPETRLKDVCRDMGTCFDSTVRYLKGLGANEKSLRDNAAALRRVDAGCKGAFVRLSPQSCTGERLNGVLIDLPDGTRLSVADCSVESLKAFFQLYHNPQTKAMLLQDV